MENLFCLCKKPEDKTPKVYKGSDQGWELLPNPPLYGHILCCNSKLLLFPKHGHVYSFDIENGLEWEKKSETHKIPVAIADHPNKKVYVFGNVTYDESWDYSRCGIPEIYDVLEDKWENLPFVNGPSGIVSDMFLNRGMISIRYGVDEKLKVIDPMISSSNWKDLEDRFLPYVEKSFIFDTTGTYAFQNWTIHKYDYQNDLMVPLKCLGIFMKETGTEYNVKPTWYGSPEGNFFLVQQNDKKWSHAYFLHECYDRPFMELWKATVSHENDCVEKWERIPLPPYNRQICHLNGGQIQFESCHDY